MKSDLPFRQLRQSRPVTVFAKAETQKLRRGSKRKTEEALRLYHGILILV